MKFGIFDYDVGLGFVIIDMKKSEQKGARELP